MTLPKQGDPRVSLGRALSKLGTCSRSQAEPMIRAGQVSVNGTVRREPSFRVDLRADRITVNGTPAKAAARTYLMLNKPRGLVTTRSDEQDRETVYRCLNDPDLPFVSPVGRLDKASEGLLLFTNDTRWAARITDPATHLDKVYHVQVNAVPNEALITSLVNGIESDVGHLSARRASVLRSGERHGWLEIVLDEGRNRQIRRLLEAHDLEVLRLVRVSVGPLALGDLAKGAWRNLTDAEQQALDSASRPR
ncbi:MAG: pseudouridine synthase Rsu [Gemmatimonadetes bacterium]|nr:pseudouridine synthase Rsu [Gemmatimonadota bacterium]